MKSASILLLLAVGVVSAQTPPPPDRFYQAIRRNDLTAVRALVSDEGVDVRDAQRQTPLMLGTALGSLGAVRVLIAASADVKASSGAGLTALHLAADNPAKTRLLLDASADVNAVSQLGRTPLLVAASASTGADVVRQLLAKGADLNVADTSGVTPLIQPSFESGFPYGHDQWISHAATAWATMGLARAAEENLASQPAASAADPFVGTYVFNPAKSTMSGAPPTAEMLLTISDEGDHLVIIPSGKTIDGAPLTGRAHSVELTSR